MSAWRCNSRFVGLGTQVRSTLRPATFPEFLLVGVPAARDEGCFESSQLGPGGVVIVVIEAFDDLERPATLEHVATYQIAPERCGFGVPTGRGEAEGALLEQKIGPTASTVAVSSSSSLLAMVNLRCPKRDPRQLAYRERARLATREMAPIDRQLVPGVGAGQLSPESTALGA